MGKAQQKSPFLAPLLQEEGLKRQNLPSVTYPLKS